MTYTIRHWAFNRTTGEVIGASRVTTLNRRVKAITAWDRAEGFHNHQWIFFHGSEGEMRAWFEKRV